MLLASVHTLSTGIVAHTSCAKVSRSLIIFDFYFNNASPLKNIVWLIPEPSLTDVYCMGWLSCRKSSNFSLSMESITIFGWSSPLHTSMMSFIQAGFPLPATAKHPHNKTDHPPYLTMGMLFMTLMEILLFFPSFIKSHSSSTVYQGFFSVALVKHFSGNHFVVILCFFFNALKGVKHFKHARLFSRKR